MTGMASGHDDHANDHGHDHGHGHDDHGHGHDDHGHAPESSFFVVPPMIVGAVIAIALIVWLGTGSGAIPSHSPFG